MVNQPAPRTHGRPATRMVMIVSGVLAVILLAVMYKFPAPYVIEVPGPAFNTLGSVHGKDVLKISGHKTYPTTGALDMLTVGVEGGPGTDLKLGDVVQSWADGHDSVIPEEAVYPHDATSKQIKKRNSAEMAGSQKHAVAAALKNMDIDYSTKLTVTGFTSHSPSKGRLQTGDVVKKIDDKPVSSLHQLKTELNTTDSGENVHLVVDKGSHQRSVTVQPHHEKSGVHLGVYIMQKYDFPFDVKIHLKDVGGPSAGMMFALGIIDSITPGPMTGGKRIAGTGTIEPDGKVGRIGGIQQKMFGAKNGGARWFLAPKPNCEDVVDHVPDGLHVVEVATLSEARHAVETIASGKNVSALPSCHDANNDNDDNESQ